MTKSATADPETGHDSTLLGQRQCCRVRNCGGSGAGDRSGILDARGLIRYISIRFIDGSDPGCVTGVVRRREALRMGIEVQSTTDTDDRAGFRAGDRAGTHRSRRPPRMSVAVALRGGSSGRRWIGRPGLAPTACTQRSCFG